MISDAESLILQIDYRFICLLVFWNDVLSNLDCVNLSFQSKTISVDLTNSLLKMLQNVRKTQLEDVLARSTLTAQDMEIRTEFSEKINIKRRGFMTSWRMMKVTEFPPSLSHRISAVNVTEFPPSISHRISAVNKSQNFRRQ